MSGSPPALGVLVLFKKVWPDDTSLSQAFPWFSQAILGVIRADGLAVYQCEGQLGERITPYSRHVYPWVGIGSTELGARSHCLLLDVTDEECARIQSTCEACVRAKLEYNTYDLLLSGVPFRDPVDLPIFKVTKIRNVQAVILIIRECVAPSDSVLGTVIRTVNSRIITPTDLFHLLTRHGTEFTHFDWKALVPEPQQVRDRLERLHPAATPDRLERLIPAATPDRLERLVPVAKPSTGSGSKNRSPAPQANRDDITWDDRW
jgi:hypothetical protein